MTSPAVGGGINDCPGGARSAGGPTDLSVRVTLPGEQAEVAGAILMDLLGPFEMEIGAAQPVGRAASLVTLVFYPGDSLGSTTASADEVLAALPPEVTASGRVRVETREVSRDWVEGWRDHFRPIVIDEVRIRPPWEQPLPGRDLVDVVINPGLGFGTGLHPTTRGVLHLLQNAGNLDGAGRPFLGPLVDAGTGSGILAIAAAKLGWGPVFAFDNDPVALVSARENVAANAVGTIVEVHQAPIEGASPYWFAGATVLANMTLEPVLALIRRLAHRQGSWDGVGSPASGPTRLVVSGILEGAQELELRGVANLCGFVQGRRMLEAEWVSLELLPTRAPGSVDDWPPVAGGS